MAPFNERYAQVNRYRTRFGAHEFARTGTQPDGLG